MNTNEQPGWSGGFDVILGNPPFVNAIENQLETQADSILKIKQPLLDGTADIAMRFVDLALTLRQPLGYVAFVQPRVSLNAKASRRLRESLPEGYLRMIGIIPDGHLFENAYVFVCLQSFGPKGSCRIVALTDNGQQQIRILDSVTTANWWGLTLPEDMIPSLPACTNAKRFIDVFDISASMTTSDFYFISKFVYESDEGNDLRMVTSGMIDSNQCLWGREKTKYQKQNYLYPRVSGSDTYPNSLQKRFEKARRPKVLVNGLSRHIKCFVDESGQYIGITSTYSIYHPDDDIKMLRKAAMTILHPEIQKLLYFQCGCTSMGTSITIPKDFLENLLLLTFSSEVLREK